MLCMAFLDQGFVWQTRSVISQTSETTCVMKEIVVTGCTFSEAFHVRPSLKYKFPVNQQSPNTIDHLPQLDIKLCSHNMQF